MPNPEYPINLDVIRKSKRFQIGRDGWIVGLTAGDQCWEPTGIRISLDPEETTQDPPGAI